MNDQVVGFIEDVSGKRAATLYGKWDESMFYVNGERKVKGKDMSSSDGCLLWKRTKPPTNLTRYNLTSFAIILNELTPGLKVVMEDACIQSVFDRCAFPFSYFCISNCFLALSDSRYLITG